MSQNLFAGCMIAAIMLTAPLPAATYLVGPAQTYKKIQDVAELLKPGDLVLVDGNATYPSGIQLSQSGTAEKWITISGLHRTDISRPLIKGTTTYGFDVQADYIILQGFEVRGRPKGIGVFGNNIIVGDCVVDSCNMGLIGYGSGTGNVTVEYSEFFGNGISTGGATQHQIYMATDELAHPGATFRLQFCYLHDGSEGDNVKSRSERNEIYYNWVENAGSSGHGLGLFAPDPDDNEDVAVETAREDADVVGNVIIQQRNACARIGGDTEGYPTNGRYRFVNNTFICTGTRGDAIRTFNTIETLEMSNNVVYATQSGSDIRILNDADGDWMHTPRTLVGGCNWVVDWATRIPAAAEWSGTLKGTVSPFVDVTTKDFRPLATGVLVNAGVAATPTVAAYPFTKPQHPPVFLPPVAALIPAGSAQTRPVDDKIDIGAFEAGSSTVLNYPGHRTGTRPDMVATASRRVTDLSGRVIQVRPQMAPGVRIDASSRVRSRLNCR